VVELSQRLKLAAVQALRATPCFPLLVLCGVDRQAGSFKDHSALVTIADLGVQLP
jgi:hypothetical protein